MYLGMALLTSHLPFLYCMLCYRSDRPSLRHNTDRLKGLLTDYTIPESNPVRKVSVSTFPSDSTVTEGLRRAERLGQQNRQGNTPWIWHDRNFDLDKLCNRGESQTQRHKRFHGRFGHSEKTNNDAACFTSKPEDIRQLLPSRFLTVDELMKKLPRRPSIESNSKAHQKVKPFRRYTLNTGYHQDLKFFTHSHCSACYTEIGYEILTEVTDFEGRNHTVLNFQNAYQFIAAGRCLNENSLCGGGGQARCSQVSRAHWTLVWTPDKGTQLVAHEVPSHCECVNVGAPLSTQEPPRDDLKRSLPTIELDNG